MSKSLIEVILLHDFQKKGKFGDRAKVKRGFAKNFLVPNKLAIYANKENLKKFEDIKAKALKESEDMKVLALELAEKINDVKISVVRQSAQDNKIFGTVSSRDISDEFQKFGFEIARNKIVINDAIKYLGVYNVKIVLHPDVVLEKEIFVVNNSGSIRNIRQEDEFIEGVNNSETQVNFGDENNNNE
jgi:large subunit ribosomal protein L9